MPKKHRCKSPARLHFGLLTVGNLLQYRYGGAGLMIDGPVTIVEAEPWDRLEIVGGSSEVALRTIEHWYSIYQPLLAADFGVSDLQALPLRIRVLETPPRHSGFGSGTQLALSVVVTAMRCLGLPDLSAKELAVATGRGQRSAIGSHGFQRGGFLVDRGIGEGENLAPLDLRIDFPTDWPIVTILPPNACGVSGADEKAAFKNLPPSTLEHRQQMVDLLKESIVPAVIERDYGAFAQSIFGYGNRSGQMFKSVQGGAYNGQVIEDAVNLVREFGVTATGQSSWGPCVFAILPNQNQTDELIDFLEQHLPAETRIETRFADNEGMSLMTESKIET